MMNLFVFVETVWSVPNPAFRVGHPPHVGIFLDLFVFYQGLETQSGFLNIFFPFPFNSMKRKMVTE